MLRITEWTQINQQRHHAECAIASINIVKASLQVCTILDPHRLKLSNAFLSPSRLPSAYFTGLHTFTGFSSGVEDMEDEFECFDDSSMANRFVRYCPGKNRFKTTTATTIMLQKSSASYKTLNIGRGHLRSFASNEVRLIRHLCASPSRRQLYNPVDAPDHDAGE